MKDQNIASLQDGEDDNAFASKNMGFPSNNIDVQERRHQRLRQSKSRPAGRHGPLKQDNREAETRSSWPTMFRVNADYGNSHRRLS